MMGVWRETFLHILRGRTSAVAVPEDLGRQRGTQQPALRILRQQGAHDEVLPEDVLRRSEPAQQPERGIFGLTAAATDRGN